MSDPTDCVGCDLDHYDGIHADDCPMWDGRISPTEIAESIDVAVLRRRIAELGATLAEMERYCDAHRLGCGEESCYEEWQLLRGEVRRLTSGERS